MLVYAKCLSPKALFFVLANVGLQMHQNRLAVGLCLEPLRELATLSHTPYLDYDAPRKEKGNGTRRGKEKGEGSGREIKTVKKRRNKE